MSENLKETIENIKQNVHQHPASVKDEATVMQAMLNDRDYEVEIYKKNGQNEMYAPGREFRGMLTNITAAATKIGKEEAAGLIDKYEIRRSDAETMVGVTKEFLYKYTETGRKFKLGGRKDMNVSLVRKEYGPGVRRYPTKLGTDENGNTIMGVGEVMVDGYAGIKASSPCPPWVNKSK
jgi:hypothetical protein